MKRRIVKHAEQVSANVSAKSTPKLLWRKQNHQEALAQKIVNTKDQRRVAALLRFGFFRTARLKDKQEDRRFASCSFKFWIRLYRKRFLKRDSKTRKKGEEMKSKQRATKRRTVATQRTLTGYIPHMTPFFVYLSTLNKQLTFSDGNGFKEYQSKLSNEKKNREKTEPEKIGRG